MIEQVPIRGTVYPSTAHAAVALGVTKDTVRSARRRGTLDTCGLGQGREYRTPVQIGPHHFETQSEASRFFGVDPATISYHNRNGSLAKFWARRQHIERFQRKADQ